MELKEDREKKNGAGATCSKKHALDLETKSHILNAISSLQFGAVEVTVHEGKVVQITRTERCRLHRSS